MPDSGTINIRGKNYETVAHRVWRFRQEYRIADGWGVVCTENVNTDQKCQVTCRIIDPVGRVVGTGTAEEIREKGRGINATSALENCETSAIGRALAACGYAGTSYASADEVQSAVAQGDAQMAAEALAQDLADAPHHRTWAADRARFCASITEAGYKYEAVKAGFCARGWPKPSAMDQDRRDKALAWLRTRKPDLGAR